MNENDFEPIEPKKRNPFYVLVAFVLALALLFLSMQGYFYLMHPEPVNIPKIEEVQTFLPSDLSEPFGSHRSNEVKIVIENTRDSIKQVANFIASKSCKKADRVCQSKALFYFVRDEVKYVPDDQFHDQLSNPLVTLKTGGADCEDMAVLLLALEKAIGNETQLVFIPGHAYAQIRIPEYKGDRWINLEPTCKTCMMNEIPDSSALAKKNYYEL
ncbi:transglutaminase family protein [Candidatus Peregrinibacteria bacterium]|nr:transglutaminase family protein [Candidatus Peregrinibacteria bacterium]